MSLRYLYPGGGGGVNPLAFSPTDHCLQFWLRSPEMKELYCLDQRPFDNNYLIGIVSQIKTPNLSKQLLYTGVRIVNECTK